MHNSITNELTNFQCTSKKRLKLAINGMSRNPIKVKCKSTATKENKNKSFTERLLNYLENNKHYSLKMYQSWYDSSS